MPLRSVIAQRGADAETPTRQHRRWLRVSSLLAAALVAASLVAGSIYVRGDANPDWYGYERMYREQGAWLSEYNRDPLFTWAVERARQALGPDGYEHFRLAVFSLLLAGALWVVFSVPAQCRLRSLHLRALTVGVAVIAIFFVKATVQVREGLAFLLIAAAIVRIINASDELKVTHAFLSYVLLAGAAFIHYGTGLYIVAFTAANAFAFVLKHARRRATVIAAICALVCAWAACEYVSTAFSALDAFGLDLDYRSEARWLKYAFWIVYGFALLALAREVRLASETMTNATGASFAIIHGAFVLPFLFVFAVLLIATDKPLPVVSMGARMLSTGAGVGLLIVLLRGRASLATLAVACFLVVDQLRTIYVAIS